jgi:hypothetical protein
VRPGPAIRHADAARIDDLPAVGQPGELHVRVPADNRHHLPRQVGEHVGPPLQPRIDQHDLSVTARRAMAEEHRSEAVDLKRDRMRQPGQQVDVIGAQLAGRPGRDLVGHCDVRAHGQRHQLAVGIAAYPGHAVAEAQKPVQDRDGLRPGGDVSRQDNAVSAASVRLG